MTMIEDTAEPRIDLVAKETLLDEGACPRSP
jgi:hypothetical protein